MKLASATGLSKKSGGSPRDRFVPYQSPPRNRVKTLGKDIFAAVFPPAN